jgi:TonB-dependent SusC/RagA subfamily outer membrane receptor
MTPVAIPHDDDSVSVGYGSQSRQNITGSVSSITAHDVETSRVSRIEELFRRVPGVQVTRTAAGDFSVRIRGAQSFMSNTEPLYILDGVPLGGGVASSALSAINPQDVARIDVLKDAGATAIFGTQGSNGVIVITTKRNRDTARGDS